MAFWVSRAYLWSKGPGRLVMIMLCGRLVMIMLCGIWRKPCPLNSGQKEEVGLTFRKQAAMRKTWGHQSQDCRRRTTGDPQWTGQGTHVQLLWGLRRVALPVQWVVQQLSSQAQGLPSCNSLNVLLTLSTLFVHEDECGQMSPWEQGT